MAPILQENALPRRKLLGIQPSEMDRHQTEPVPRFVVQCYFEDWAAFDRDNTRIWNTYYRPKPLFDHLPTWQEWLPEYRQLIIEVQDMVAEHTAQGTWKRPGNVYERNR